MAGGSSRPAPRTLAGRRLGAGPCGAHPGDEIYARRDVAPFPYPETDMAGVPSERALFSTYRLWRRYADPDGLVSAAEFAEMDDDDKREALRELGGVQPVEAGAVDSADDADDDENGLAPSDDDDDTGGRHVELTEDIVDPRSADPFA